MGAGEARLGGTGRMETQWRLTGQELESQKPCLPRRKEGSFHLNVAERLNSRSGTREVIGEWFRESDGARNQTAGGG